MRNINELMKTLWEAKTMWEAYCSNFAFENLHQQLIGNEEMHAIKWNEIKNKRTDVTIPNGCLIVSNHPILKSHNVNGKSFIVQTLYKKNGGIAAPSWKISMGWEVSMKLWKHCERPILKILHSKFFISIY